MASGKKKLKTKNTSRIGGAPARTKASAIKRAPVVPRAIRPDEKTPQRVVHLRSVSAALRAELHHCAHDPAVESIHHLRTGTRRLQAMLETVVREATPSDHSVAGMRAQSLAHAEARWARLLKRIRRAAGPVRDLDVHRQLLRDLLGPPQSPAKESSTRTPETSIPIKSNPPAAPDAPRGHLEKQIAKLDRWLDRERQHQSAVLTRVAQKALKKFDTREAAFDALLARYPIHSRVSRSAASVALESFVELAELSQSLDAANLHNFRKGAKKARYIAESGGDDPHAIAVGKALKRLQDDIGEWHDWLVLAAEARTALSKHGAALFAILDRHRDVHYAAALRTATRLRERLVKLQSALQQRARSAPPVPAHAISRSLKSATKPKK